MKIIQETDSRKSSREDHEDVRNTEIVFPDDMIHDVVSRGKATCLWKKLVRKKK